MDPSRGTARRRSDEFRVRYGDSVMKSAFSSAARLSWVLILVVLSSLTAAMGQAPIRFVKTSKIFILDAGKVTYVFGINEQNILQHIYWGGHVGREEDFRTPSTGEWSPFDLTGTPKPLENPACAPRPYSQPVRTVPS